MEFKNTTVFFIPVWFTDYPAFTDAFRKSGEWEPLPAEELRPSYLLNYAARLAENPDAYTCWLKKSLPALELPAGAVADQIRFSCFATGAGFIEVWICYEGLGPKEITDFAFGFKKAYDGVLYRLAQELLPAPAEVFFTANQVFKRECLCFHMIYTGREPVEEEDLIRLRRSYSNGFALPQETGDYDMLYTPYAHDRWAGSQEGLANLVCDSGQEKADAFLHRHKYAHLTRDYRFLYLLLMNQRFSAIQYITQIAESDRLNRKEMEQLNRRVVTLKTAFSFNVISDDLLFQNVYAKMYRILDIDRLLADIQDNEEQMEILQNASSAAAEKRASDFLMGISLLSLFSALIDASSYFDRFSSLKKGSDILSLLCVLGVVVLCVVWMWRSRRRK